MHSATHFECIEKGETDRGLRDNNNDDNDDANDGEEATSTLRVHNRNENRNTLNESMHIERRASVWVNGILAYTPKFCHSEVAFDYLIRI